MQKLFAFFCVVVGLLALTHAETADYSIDLYPGVVGQAGHLEISNLQFGGKEANTVELTFKRGGTEANYNCLFYFRGISQPVDGALLFSAKLNSNSITVQVGTSTVTSNTFTITNGAWYTLTITVFNTVPAIEMYIVPLADKSSATVILPKTAIASGLVLGSRMGYVGYCEFATPALFHGKVDDLRFWDVARDFTMQIIPAAGAPEVPTGFDTGLVVQYTMNEGQGQWVYATDGPAFGQNSFAPAKLVKGAWATQANSAKDDCYIWGDPHMVQSSVSRPDPSWNADQNSYGLYQSCAASATEEPYFAVHMHHYTCDSPDGRVRDQCLNTRVATTIYAITIYAYGHRYYFNRQRSEIFKYECDPNSDAPTLESLNGVTPYTEDGVYWSVDGNFNYYFYVPLAGYITVSRGSWSWGYYFNIHIYTFTECTYRAGNCDQQTWQTRTYDERWFYFCDSASTEESSDVTEPSSSDSCDWATKDATYYAWAKKRCAGLTTVGSVVMTDAYNQCLEDYCFGDKIDYCASNQADSLCHMAEFVASKTGTEVDPICDLGCPNNCNTPNGVCDTSVSPHACKCAAGWTGPDCCTRSVFTCLSWTQMDDLKLHPFLLNHISAFPGPTGAQSEFASYMEELPHIDDTLIVMVASYLKPDNTIVNAMYFSVDRKYKAEATQTVSWTVTSSSALTVAVLDSTYMAYNSATKTFTATLDGSFSSGKGMAPAAMIYDPAEGDYTITVADTDALSQILIGTGSLLDMDVEMYKVGDDQNGIFTIHVGECTDLCSVHTECDACAADTACGWCRDSNTCMMGDATGPTSNTMCYNWRYSFSSSSRVLTTSFGWPLFPGREEIIIDSTDDLPVDVTIDVVSSYWASWDAIYAWPIDVQKNQGDRRYLVGMVDGILNTLKQYASPYISIFYYTPGDSDAFNAALSMSKASTLSTAELRSAISAIPFTNSPVGLSVKIDLTDLLLHLASEDVSFWRVNSKHMALISVDRSHVALSDDEVLEIRKALAKANIVPVFAATEDVYDEYEELVSRLNFGVLVELMDDSENYLTVIQKAYSRAIGQVVLLKPEQNVDTFDSSTLYMYGLTESMKAHFVIPVIGSPVELVAPGFGTATIKSVATEKPEATGEKTYVYEDNYYPLWAFTGTIIRLTGKGYAGYPIVPTVLNSDTYHKLNGALYQFTGSGLGDQITGETLVSDKLGRVIYVSPANAFSGNDAPYDTIYYEVSDLCLASDEGQIPIYIIGVNDPPTVTVDYPSGTEDLPLLINLQGKDIEDNTLEFIVDTVKETSGLEGKLYQYSAALMADVSLAGTAGYEALTYPATVTDPSGRVIYVGCANCNSEGIPSSLKVKPKMTFHAMETCCCGNCAGDTTDASDYGSDDSVLPSVPLSFDIYLAPVNDAPRVYQERRRGVRDTVSALCWKSCTYEEDFGNPQGKVYNPAQLFMGGSDIEESPLNVTVVATTCPQGTLWYADDRTLFSLATSRGISGFVTGKLAPALLFKPLADQYSGTTTPYCTVEYKVNDGELDSLDTNVITIYVTPVNDLPRLEEDLITGFEDHETYFTAAMKDIDNTAFDATIMSCSGVGQLSVKLNGKYVPVDCSVKEPVTLKVTSSAYNWDMLYVPPANEAKEGLMKVVLKLDDHQAEPGVTENDYYTIVIDIIPINDAPLIGAFTETPVSNLDYSLTLKPSGEDSHVTFNLNLVDIDSKSGELDLVLVSPRGAFTWEPAPKIPAEITVVSRTDSEIHLFGTVDMLNTIISTIGFQAPKDDADFHITITANDNGYNGVCEPDENGEYETSCPLTATMSIHVVVNVPSDPTTVAIAGGVAGAGALLGLGAAAGLYMFFRHHPGTVDEYHPWAMDGESTAVSNPFYADMGNTGSNPLFNG